MTDSPPVLLVGASGWIGRQLARDSERRVEVVPARTVLNSDGGVLSALVRSPHPLVINAAGLKAGNPEDLHEVNVHLVEVLASWLGPVGGHLVHLGSAAEYGLGQPDGYCDESAECAPESPYGRTKLMGTQVALDSGCATVLRLFNILSVPPQPGSPLEDVSLRTRAAIRSGSDVELMSAQTVRDWVPIDFVLASVTSAVSHRPHGVFNVCSGVGVGMGDAVNEACRLLSSASRVRDLRQVPATTVVGSPEAWRALSGLCFDGRARAVAEAIAGSVGPVVS